LTKKRLIIYDLDGTLVDTLEDIVRSANHMLQAMGAPLLSRDQVRRLVGRGMHQLVGDCLGTDDPQRIEDGLAVYRAHYAEHLLDHSCLYPGARELLDHFKDRRQAVITNKPDPYSTTILQQLQVAQYFCRIVAGDAEFSRKPDPAAVLALMRQAQVSAGETIFIGDSAIDVETGRGAGVLTIAVSHRLGDLDELKAARPDVLVEDLSGVLDRAQHEGW
jgi:phosphoglycolate phosphatase